MKWKEAECLEEEKRTYTRKIKESHYNNKFIYNVMNVTEGSGISGYGKGWMQRGGR